MAERQRARVTDADKVRLVQAFERGEDYVDLAWLLGVKRSTAYTIIRRSQMPPRANNWGGEQKRKMDDEMMDMLVTIVEEHPPFTLNQINNELRIRLPNKPHVGRTTLMKGLGARLLILKKLEDAPEERNSERTKTERRDFAQWLINDGIRRAEMVFIDEAGVNLYTARTRGRARRGQRAVRVVNGRRGMNVTYLFCHQYSWGSCVSHYNGRGYEKRQVY